MNERYETFTLLISNINRGIRKLKSEEMSEYDLKSPHVSCIYYLYHQKSLTAKELCDICDEDKGAVSRSIEFLENNGYIKCESKNSKRYKSPLTLTEKGLLVGEKLSNNIDCIIDEVSKGLCENERKIMYKSLSLINNNIKELLENYGGK